MPKDKKERKKPERNWVPISVILIVLSVYSTILYSERFSQEGIGFLALIYLLGIWFLDFFYTFVNFVRENPEFELHKVFVAIKKIEVYESWYFLSALGLIFGLIFFGIFLNVDKILGIAICGILYTFLFAWIRDILKHRRDKQS